MRNIHKSSLLAAMIVCAACAAETVEPESSSKLPVSAPTATLPATTSMTGLGAAGSAPIAPAPNPAVPISPAASAPAKSPAPEGAAPAPASPTPAAPAPAKPPVVPMAPAGQPPAVAGSSGNTAADKFCDKYGEHCKYAMPNRHADRAACIANFNATPAQQACKNMHMDTAIAGTAAACNGMPSAFCFSIHCLHVAAIPDPTGVTYCK